jgi:hypothetical protein
MMTTDEKRRLWLDAFYGGYLILANTPGEPNSRQGVEDVTKAGADFIVEAASRLMPDFAEPEFDRDKAARFLADDLLDHDGTYRDLAELIIDGKIPGVKYTPPTTTNPGRAGKKGRAMDIETIAMIAHETNRHFCEANDDWTQKEWADSPSWQRDSAINGVKFHMANPDAGDSASHDNWMAQKVAEGWTYGPVKDPDAKKHPCMVPFGELPPVQQAKDALFRGICHALLPLIARNESPAA